MVFPHEDHPRSRGVYRAWSRPGCCAAGSSPLARGLLPAKKMEAALDGIIPARAGFTQCARNDFRCETDHPRSRGVYLLSLFLCSPHSGSSPLARGLPHGPYSFSQWAGIIPARAGFTTPGPGVRGCTGDHPRSRGVYSATATTTSSRPGSSPLARGLRHQGVRRRRVAGIIPARAGFTPHGGTGGTSGGDHPRSRGVYR